MRTYGTLSRELSCSKSHSSSAAHVWSSRWQFSSESREAGLCLALHPAPLATQLVFGGESFARTVRHEHRRLGAMPRLATGTAHGVDGRRSTTTRERRRLLFNCCLRRSTTAVRRLRSERRLERGRGSGLGKGKV